MKNVNLRMFRSISMVGLSVYQWKHVCVCAATTLEQERVGRC